MEQTRSKLSLKKKPVPAKILTFLIISFTLMSLFSLANAIDVQITAVFPTSQRGRVGEEVIVVGTINTTDGLYQLWLGDKLIANKTATENNIEANFTIPELPGGNYTITLIDVDKNTNATTWFYIDTAYYIKAIAPTPPKQLQEGSSLILNVTVTGGQQNTIYYANVTVKLPSPLETAYSAIVPLTNTTNTGNGYGNVAYPNATLFQPSGSHTNFTGSYIIYFNRTENLAADQFFVSLTNASEYHREELVEIRAIDYQPNETATITIKYPTTNTTLYSEVVNASDQGVINATWTVPSNASIGNYNITIISDNTTKQILDSQLFRVPGYPIDIYARNLAGDTVPQILVEALDEVTNTTFSNTSETTGIAYLWLEKGNHTMEAFWNKVKVGEAQVTIAGKDVYNLTCELTNLKITVKDSNGILIPFVELNVTYQYVTTKESKLENGSALGQTDILGVFSFNSTLPHINYTVNASRYGIVFNTDNKTIQDLPAEPSFQVTILCPAKTLTLKTLEHHRGPLPNARIEMIEQMGGISYSEVTNDAGAVTISCTFGKYKVKVYVGSILLNETFVEVFNDTQNEIYCRLYNLTLSVKIIDYFGQPIPNADVTLRREDLTPRSTMTLQDGIAAFNNVIGGNLQVTVDLPGQAQQYVAMDYYIDEPTQIEIKVGEYVVLAGLLIETTLLTTLLIILVSVISVIGIEVYRRRRFKPTKRET